MTQELPTHGLELRSIVTSAGELRLSLENVEISAPTGDQILVRVEATPINPSDLGLLVGPADVANAKVAGGVTPPRCRRA